MSSEIARLRSENSHVRAFAKFINKTERPIAVEWLDYRGDHVSYKDALDPGEEMGMNTYVGHPWVFYETECRIHGFDYDSHCSVLQDGVYGFYGFALRHRLSPHPGQDLIYFPVAWDGASEIHYHLVTVHNQLLPLRQCALQALHRHLSVALGHRNLDKFTAKVAELNLPPILVEDLIDLCKNQNNRNIPILPPRD